jgi:ribosomal protein S18 acetylase RimI-like enzyme
VNGKLAIRDARPGDEGVIHALLWEFAEFEKLTDKFRLTTEAISRDFMGEKRRVQCDVAEWDGALVAVMIWYRMYGTFSAQPGLFLEDLYVRPEFRRRGIAKALLRQLVHYARREEANRIGWFVLDWNTSAMDFYDRIGARAVPEWRIYSLDAYAFDRLADA